MNVDAPSPDPQIGAASKEAIQLGRDQFDAQQALLAKFTPLYEEQVRLSQDAQAKNTARSDAQWDNYTTNFKPLEEKMAATVAGYDTQERRDKAAADAMAGVTGTFDQARQGLTESLNQQGIGGSSGKGLALRNAMAIEEAKAKAGAGASAIRGVESTGLSLLGSATNFGRGLTNTGLQTGQAAQSNGNNATGQVSGLSGLTGAGFGAAMQGIGTGVNGLVANHQAELASFNASNAAMGDMIGAGAGIFGMMSTKKAKKQGAKVDGKKALKGLAALDVDEWTYKPGMGDGGDHVGPYAEDVNREFGDGVAPGGKMLNMVEMSDVNAKALRELTAQVAGLKKELLQLEAA